MGPGVAYGSAWVRLTHLPPVSSAAGADGQHVNHVLGVAAVKDHAPVPDSQPPQPFRAAETLHVTIGQRIDRRADPLAVPTTEAPQRLQRGRADLHPPLPPGSSVSAQPRAHRRPSDSGFAACLTHSPEILVGQLLIVIWCGVELGDHRVLGTAEQHRDRRKRLFRQRVDQLV